MSKDLDTVAGILYDTFCDQCLYINRHTIVERLKRAQIDSHDFLCISVGKTSLGKTSVQGHLATLKPRSGRAGTCLLTFMTLTGCLAVPGTMSTASSKIIAVHRALRRS